MSARASALCVAMALSLWPGGAFARAAALTWERAFPVERSAPDVHLQATFTGSDGRPHHLELWRRGRSFLHRRTDDALDLYVVETQPSQYAYRFVDHRRHVVTGVRRDNLYRIGVFSDWFGLAHVVDRPKAAFAVRAAEDPRPSAPRRDCVWREVVTGGPAHESVARVCWSPRWAAALAIATRGADGAWTETFSVRAAEPARFHRGETALPATPAAYAFVDADREIAPQSND